MAEILKVRIMGTDEDIQWFWKFLKTQSEVKMLSNSPSYKNKGTKRYLRAYAEIMQAKEEKKHV